MRHWIDRTSVSDKTAVSIFSVKPKVTCLIPGGGVKRPGCGLDLPHPSSVEIKERVKLYGYSPSVNFYTLLIYRQAWMMADLDRNTQHIEEKTVSRDGVLFH